MATVGRGDGGEKVKRGGRGKGESGLAGGRRRGVVEEEEGGGPLSLCLSGAFAHTVRRRHLAIRWPNAAASRPVDAHEKLFMNGRKLSLKLRIE